MFGYYGKDKRGGNSSKNIFVDTAVNQALRRDVIRESIAHEGGHGFHLEHYFTRSDGAGGINVLDENRIVRGGLHFPPFWSVMLSNVITPVPQDYDDTDVDQIRIHLKH